MPTPVSKPELLAPAGSMQALRAAARFGADAVYIGGPSMQLRAASAGFSREEIEQAAALLHRQGKKLYVTVNCFARDEEIDALAEYGRFLEQAGVDAAIVSDLGAIAELRDKVPGLDVHVSTQANCLNARAAGVYTAMGARRLVAAREMSIAQIARMHESLPGLEIEAFVHGAMCMAYSGRCLLSSFLVNRSGNRGECAQPCRWVYHLTEQKRPGEFFPIEQDQSGFALLSSRDLCCISFLDKLVGAGVSSLKIEGRMKSSYYVATIVNAYRLALDGGVEPAALEREVCSVSHRPYCPGFYFGEMPAYPPDDGAYIRDCAFAAVALEDAAGGRVRVQQRNRFRLGDRLEVLRPGKVGESFEVCEIRTALGLPAQQANHAAEELIINCPYPLQAGDMLRIRTPEVNP